MIPIPRYLIRTAWGYGIFSRSQGDDFALQLPIDQRKLSFPLGRLNRQLNLYKCICYRSSWQNVIWLCPSFCENKGIKGHPLFTLFNPFFNFSPSRNSYRPSLFLQASPTWGNAPYPLLLFSGLRIYLFCLYWISHPIKIGLCIKHRTPLSWEKRGRAKSVHRSLLIDEFKNCYTIALNIHLKCKRKYK